MSAKMEESLIKKLTFHHLHINRPLCSNFKVDSPCWKISGTVDDMDNCFATHFAWSGYNKDLKLHTLVALCDACVQELTKEREKEQESDE